MLDHQFTITVSDRAWNSAVSNAVLSVPCEEFFSESGATPVAENTRRRYRRVRARGRAIVVRGKELYGVITTDISPLGIGFFSPIQLLPKEKVTLLLDQSDQLSLEIRRCVRSDDKCYGCGAIFRDGPFSPAQYHRFLNELRA